MSTRSRKRRHTQAFPEEEENEELDDVDDGNPKYVESTGQDRLDKEREVWDAFKDEHVEVFDLSSSLWRRFDLVRELDQQDARTTASLLDSFMKYVHLRRALVQPPTPAGPRVPETEAETLENPELTELNENPDLNENPELKENPELTENPKPNPEDLPQLAIANPATDSDEPLPPANGAENVVENGASSSLNKLPVAPPPLNTDRLNNSRELLATIAKLAAVSIRDREEKVNLTLAACDSVERSIRLLDQAIQEQEHAISLGARPGTRLAPILLPELVMPRWSKPARVTLSPDLDDALGGGENKAPAPSQQRRKKPKKGRKRDAVPNEAVVPPPRPKPPHIPNPDPTEPRYCYCDQVSFGEMIACDDPRCAREWFHLSCTGLPTAPEGRKKWFCDECTLRKNQKRNR
ncbi:hypothetical protein C8F04DRAFT_1074537 [Mycena alexandri]|uniref:Chromatin modification-related protein n=1 Tax=Mycena alexandri TaxID=1745969 RepID=A0AAD6TFJ8_9AGAR|nr:hypothetical protein C8F04DRAFT_1074537 [Mycena alexandri]